MKLLAIVIALVCFAAAGGYWTGALQFGTSHAGPHHSHAILLGVIGVLALVWMRFQRGAAAPSAR